MFFAQHSQAFATVEAIDASTVDHAAIENALMMGLVDNQKLRTRAVFIPLTLLVFMSQYIPERHLMWMLVGIQAIVHILAFFMAHAMERAVSQERPSPMLRMFWLFLIFLAAFMWGTMTLPIVMSFGAGIANTFIGITLAVTISVGCLMTANVRSALWAHIGGVAVALVPQAFCYFAYVGLIPIAALAALIPSHIWIAGHARQQARKALGAQLQNQFMATHLKQALSASEFLSQRDSLTGLLNRRAFEAAIESMRNKACAQTTLILLDLDHFKRVNDTFGHAVGDDVLRMTAQLISNFARPETIGAATTEAIARWGGEEFIVALSDCSLEAALVTAEQMRARLAHFRDATWPETLHVTGSFGVTRWETDELLHEAIGRADKAMYQAKVAGRNRVVTTTAGDEMCETDDGTRLH